MSTLLLTYDPLYTRIGIVLLAVLLVAGYIVYYARQSRKARAQAAASVSAHGSASPQLFENSFLRGPSALGDLMRGALILLAVGVAAGLTLIVLPENTIDRMAQSMRLRTAAPPQQERISLLYLGDETKGKEFHIRGVIRNISTLPIEKVDATVRLYAPDGILIETAVVRMDAELIAPDATSSFNLAYPDYNGQFTSYTVDFKLRQGEALPYKDMRGAQGRS